MDLKNKIKSILKKQVRSFTLVSESYVYVSATRNGSPTMARNYSVFFVAEMLIFS